MVASDGSRLGFPLLEERVGYLFGANIVTRRAMN
jgi:hypothetical protein